MSLCSCGNEKYGKRNYCKECYMIFSRNQSLRTKTKKNQLKFDKLSIYINKMELRGGFELQDINEIINIYESFYGSEFNILDRSVGYMWKALKRLNNKTVKNEL